MKKISAILSPMVILMASTSLAQDSCIRRPSCEDMGYNKSVADCAGKTTLKCPFNLDMVSCSASEAAIECDWGERLTVDNTCKKIENAIAFVIETTANNASITLTTNKTNITVDWGDGTTEDISNTTNPSHSYAKVGQYEVVITGNVEHFCIRTCDSCYAIRILNIDLDSVISYGHSYSSYGYCPSGKTPFGDCSKITGEIPNKLPPNLKEAEYLFYNCKNLYGDIPDLPNTLERGDHMFYQCENLSGDLPRLPNALSSAGYMFSGCKNLTGSIQNFPDNLSYASYMFNDCSNLTGTIPELPGILSWATSMFYNCSKLEQIGFTKFPDTLTEAGSMFYNCSRLEGQIPSLANTQITSGREMFYGCSYISGTAPALPNTLTDGTKMFYSTGVSGHVPDLPTSLTSAEQMFTYSAITSIGDLPQGITDMGEMFNGCINLTSVGNLPSGLLYMDKAFANTKLTQLPPNFADLTNLKNVRAAFSGCSKLTGTLPSFSTFPSINTYSSYYKGAFYETKINDNPSDPWPAEAWQSPY